MKAIYNLLMLTIVVVYIVDLSGFTEAWKAFLWRKYKVSQDRPIKPLDCSMCMTWWLGLFYLLCHRHLTLPMVAYVAMLSILTIPIGQLLILIRESLTRVISKMIDKL